MKFNIEFFATRIKRQIDGIEIGEVREIDTFDENTLKVRSTLQYISQGRKFKTRTDKGVFYVIREG